MNIKRMKKKLALRSSTNSGEVAYRQITKISIISMFCVSVLTAVISFSILGVADFKLSEKYVSTLSSSLGTVSNNIDNIYEICVDEPMSNMLMSQHFIAFAFSSKQYPATPYLKSLLRSDLSNLVQSNELVSGAFVYSVSADSYVSSSYNLTAEKAEYYNSILYEYNANSLNAQKMNYGVHNTFIFHYGDSDVIAKNLTAKNGLTAATLFFVIKSDSFCAMINDAFSEKHPIFVNIYDSESALLFTTYDGQNISEDVLKTLSVHPGEAIRQGKNYLFYYQSELLTWRYVIFIDRTSLSTPLGLKILLFSLTLICVSLLICIIIKYTLSKRRNEIDQIMSSLRDGVSADEIVGGDVFEYLSLASSNIISRLRFLEASIEPIKSSAMSVLFTKLIGGQQIAPDTIRQTLALSNSGVSENSLYVSCVLRYVGQAPLDVSMRTDILRIIDETASYHAGIGHYQYIAFPTDMEHFALILAFDSDLPVGEGIEKTNNLTLRLAEGLDQAGMSMIIRRGHLYHSILDVAFSYSEGIRGINRAIQISKQGAADHADFRQEPPLEGTETPDQHDPSENAPGADQVVGRRSYQIVALLYAEKKEEAHALLDRTVEELSSNRSAGRLIQPFANDLLEQMLGRDFVQSSQLPNIDPALSPQETIVQLYSLCDAFYDVIQRQRNPNIIAARKYIEKNYADAALTLEAVAEYLGITSNYLSSLFSKNLGKKLVDYMNEYRIDKSVEELLHTDKTIAEISVGCGFSSARNYIRVFKRVKSITPGEYRKLYRDEGERN